MRIAERLRRAVQGCWILEGSVDLMLFWGCQQLVCVSWEGEDAAIHSSGQSQGDGTMRVLGGPAVVGAHPHTSSPRRAGASILMLSRWH